MTEENREPFIVIVVLNWNRCGDTLDCLNSLHEQAYTNFKIVVVDNGSTDRSVPAISEAFPEISIIQNASNLGYSAGNNIGIRAALALDAEFVLLLNNDTIVDPLAIRHLVDEVGDRCDIAAAGPKIVYADNPQRIWAAGGVIDFRLDITRHRGYDQVDRGQFDEPTAVDYLPGCAILFRRTALDQIGLLDEIYSPAYFEDSDWALRAARGGFKLVYSPSALIRHKVSSSSGGSYNVFERYMLGYNGMIFLGKYASRLQRLKYLAQNFIAFPFIILWRAFKGGWWAVGYKILGILDALSGRPRRQLLA